MPLRRRRQFGTEIQAQVQARQTGGDTKVFYIDTAGWTTATDFSDGLHPTGKRAASRSRTCWSRR